MSDLDDFPETTASETPKPDTTIGPYKLLEQIGEGGMGSVWVASQSEPIKRRVAIKLIKAGMDTGQVLARFDAERQALAMMDHPNIARVLDGGMTEQGRPYFAMEYVKGVPLTEYCDNAKLSLKERLELFVPVCQAVQHAHQKGIIHRDLKPSNILVCLYDGKPVPKVIDFGLAKAMHHSLTDQSIYTAHGMMVGTPLYMSPEQAEQNNLDIDTRTDVYALGVILYELLTGTTPLERAEMKQAAYDEVLRLIKEVEPPKPSTRLSGSESLPSVAAQRGIEPAQLTRSITGDLDWVVMKALEKERSRRYETANGLAEDIRRHLSDEPVSASPPSTSYRVKKFIRRNRVGVLAASVIALTLLLGVVGTTGGMFWALEERKEAVAAREAESDTKLEAQENAKQAEAEATRAATAEAKTAETLEAVEAERDAKEVALKEAEQLSEFLTSVFQSPDPTRDGREIKVIELLDNAAKQLETDLADQPLQRAKLQESLGKTYVGLGLYDKAIALQEQVRDYALAAHGAEHVSTLAAINNLANSYYEIGRRDDALKMREELLTLARKLFGPEHSNTLRQMQNLAGSYDAAGRYTEAFKMREEVVALTRKINGAEHPDTLGAIGGLAISYVRRGQMDEAVAMFEEGLTIRRKVNGSEHPHTLREMSNLAVAYNNAGRIDEALKLGEELLPLSRKVYGPEHPSTLNAIDILSNAYFKAGFDAGLRDKAFAMREELLTLSRKVLGPEHPRTLSVMDGLAVSYFAADFLDKSLTIREDLLALRRKVLGPEHSVTIKTLNTLTSTALFIGVRHAWESKDEEQANLIRRLADHFSQSEDPRTLSRVARIACLAPNADPATYQTAAQLARKALELGKDDPDSQDWRHLTLGMALYRTEDFAEAEQVLDAEPLKQSKAAKTASFFRAMAMFQQGKEQPARDLFAATKEAMDPPPEENTNPPRGQGTVWSAHREADALINN